MKSLLYLIVSDVEEINMYGEEIKTLKVLECFLNKSIAEKFVQHHYGCYMKEMNIETIDNQSEYAYLVVTQIDEIDYYGNVIDGVSVHQCFLDESKAIQYQSHNYEYEYSIKKIKLGEYNYPHVKEKKLFATLNLRINASFFKETNELSAFLLSNSENNFQNPQVEIDIETIEAPFEIPTFSAYVSGSSFSNEIFDSHSLDITIPISLNPTIQQDLLTKWEKEVMDIFFFSLGLFKENGHSHYDKTSQSLKKELVKRKLYNSSFEKELN